MNSTGKFLISIVGPTAVGKTAAAIALAQHFPAQIISADSRQFYREMSVGTAKPTRHEQAQAVHHFIDSHSVTQPFNVADFETESLARLEEIFKEHNMAILAGGSGLYVKAVTDGFDELPKVDLTIRDALNSIFANEGITALQKELKTADPVYFDQVDINNPQRLIRALEVYRTTGQPFSSYRTGDIKKRPFTIIKIGLDMPREELYRRVDQRVDLMMENGLLNEVKELLPYRHLNALNTVGYSELFDHLDGKIDLDTAVALIKQNTRRFAKRQLTWFKRDRDIQWFAPTDIPAMVTYINDVLKRSNA